MAMTRNGFFCGLYLTRYVEPLDDRAGGTAMYVIEALLAGREK